VGSTVPSIESWRPSGPSATWNGMSGAPWTSPRRKPVR
jgi:hypothetical protein